MLFTLSTASITTMSFIFIYCILVLEENREQKDTLQYQFTRSGEHDEG